MTPQRIQRKRTRGWKMPENTVYVGRPTKWGNPYHLPVSLTDTFRASLIKKYEDYVNGNPELLQAVKKNLKGKNLACFCSLEKSCHADVLLKIANQ